MPHIDFNSNELVIVEKLLRHAKFSFIVGDSQKVFDIVTELNDCYKFKELILSSHEKVAQQIMRGFEGREQGAEELA